MEIEFVTHASVLMRTNDVNLLTDPWIEGAAFDNGWSLLSPPPKSYQVFREATHVWFSHEHPDHFAPPVLKKVPPEVRARLTVLMIETVDKKIVNFCRSLGFGTVLEIPPYEWHALSTGTSIMLGPVDDDSWCALKADGKTVLNVNDCCLQTPDDIAPILRCIGGEPEVLLTQFSYAQWSGNPEDVETRRAEALRKLNEFRLHIKQLKPRWVIPFASYIWFSHSENVYLNDSCNRIDAVAEVVRKETSAVPVVLYPGDVWNVGAPWDSSSAVDRYLADLDTLSASQPTIAPSVEASQLQSDAAKFLARAREKSGTMVLRAAALTGILPEAHIWVSDQQRAVALSVGGMRPDNRSQEACDVELSSAALAYVLRFDWGGNTLDVNGRFRKPRRGNYHRFQAWSLYGNQCNHGRPLTAFDVVRHVLKPIYRGPLLPIWRAIRKARGRTSGTGDLSPAKRQAPVKS
jgi:UDP-MurNAc hydroxylase